MPQEPYNRAVLIGTATKTYLNVLAYYEVTMTPAELDLAQKARAAAVELLELSKATVRQEEAKP